MLAYVGNHWHLLNDNVEAIVGMMFPGTVKCIKVLFIKGLRQDGQKKKKKHPKRSNI